MTGRDRRSLQISQVVPEEGLHIVQRIQRGLIQDIRIAGRIEERGRHPVEKCEAGRIQRRATGKNAVFLSPRGERRTVQPGADAPVEVGPVGRTGPGAVSEKRQKVPPRIHEIVFFHAELRQGGHAPGYLLHRGVHIFLVRVDGDRIFDVARSIGAAEIGDTDGGKGYRLLLQGVTKPLLDDDFELFGEDIDEGGVKVLLISPKQYTLLRKSSGWLPASDISADIAIKGVVGMVQGCQVIISNKLTEASSKENAYIVKPGALRLFMKRGTLVESDRDIVNKSTVVTADKHFAPYLYDASKAIKIIVK